MFITFSTNARKVKSFLLLSWINELLLTRFTFNRGQNFNWRNNTACEERFVSKLFCLYGSLVSDVTKCLWCFKAGYVKPHVLLSALQVEFIIFIRVQKDVKWTSELCLIMCAQSRNLPLTSRHIEFDGPQHVIFNTRRDKKFQVQVRSLDAAKRTARVRENQIEDFIRAYEAGGTSMTKDNNDNK